MTLMTASQWKDFVIEFTVFGVCVIFLLAILVMVALGRRN